MLRKSILVLLLLLISGGESALAEQTIVCATSVDTPPMEFVDQDGNIAGYAIDFIRAAGRIAGFKPEFKNIARDVMTDGLQAGQYDAICSSAFLGEESRKAMDISAPYYIARQVLVVNKATRIYSTTDMQGALIGALQGAAADTLQVGKLKQYADLGKAMEDLYVQRIDGLVSDDVVATYYARVKYQNRLTVTGYLGEGNKIYYGVAVKKGNKQALDLLNQGISGVQAREIDKELQMKWFAH